MKNNNKENFNQSINEERRKLLGMAGVASAGALLSPLISKAAPSTIIEAGSNVDTASYIIFKDGSIIYAKNGTTGKIEFQGMDAAMVIQGAINSLTSGGKIFIKNGIYTMTSGVVVLNDNIIIEGEGLTMLRSNFGAAKVVGVIRVEGNHCTIENIIFDGNDPTDTGLSPVVSIYGTGNTFQNNIVQNGLQYGFEFFRVHNAKCVNNIIKNCQYGIAVSRSGVEYSTQILIAGNHISDCKDVGIKLRGVIGCIVANNLIDINGISNGSNYCSGIRCYHEDAPCIDTLITGNYIEDTGGIGTNPGIDVSNDATDTARRISITNNHIRNCQYGIMSAWKDVHIAGNTIFGRSTGYTGIDIIAARNHVEGNHIYNSGIMIYSSTGYSVDQSLVENNFITGGSQYWRSAGDGITVMSQTGSTANNVIIKNNQIYTVSGYGINIYLAAGFINPIGTIIQDNILTSCAAGYINNSGTSTVIKNNHGYKTENKGAFSISDGGTITHNLSKTPTSVRVTPSVAGELVSVTSISSTTFTVAIKKPDGSSGTPQTIYWEAEV